MEQMVSTITKPIDLDRPRLKPGTDYWLFICRNFKHDEDIGRKIAKYVCALSREYAYNDCLEEHSTTDEANFVRRLPLLPPWLSHLDILDENPERDKTLENVLRCEEELYPDFFRNWQLQSLWHDRFNPEVFKDLAELKHTDGPVPTYLRLTEWQDECSYGVSLSHLRTVYDIEAWSNHRRDVFALQHAPDDPIEHARCFRLNLAETILDHLVPVLGVEWYDLTRNSDWIEAGGRVFASKMLHRVAA